MPLCRSELLKHVPTLAKFFLHQNHQSVELCHNYYECLKPYLLSQSNIDCFEMGSYLKKAHGKVLWPLILLSLRYLISNKAKKITKKIFVKVGN